MTKILVGTFCFLSFVVHAASWQITFPKPVENATTIDEYPVQLLSLALDQTGVNYQLIPSEGTLTKSKAIDKLISNREINLVWGMTSPQRETDLLPIRIPIFKGLVGWRLLLIRQDMAERFEYIQTLEHLLKLSPLQGRDWPDTKILQSNGFDVITDRSQIGLINMLGNAQGDFFPRSIVEIWEELATSDTKSELVIQKSIGIRYPAAIYFFVNKNSVPLANLIKTGLEKAIENGKFQRLFIDNYQSYIEKAQIDQRTFYPLENTFLPEKTPLQRSELWFDGQLRVPVQP